MMFQLASSVVAPSTCKTALVRIGSQTPNAADSATLISVAFSQCRLGQRRICPRDKGAMSRNATTVGVERTGYAEPPGVLRTFGVVDGGMFSAIMQNGQGILTLQVWIEPVPLAAQKS